MGRRCDNCRFWTETTHESFDRSAVGDCSRLLCSRATTTAKARIYPVDASAWLETGADFSCSEYQPLAVKSERQRNGGLARAEKLSPERRSEIAKRAAYARWGADQ